MTISARDDIVARSVAQMLRCLLLAIALPLLVGCDDRVIEPRNPGASIARIEADLPPADSARFHDALRVVLHAHHPDSLYAAIHQPDSTGDPELFAPVFNKTPEEVIAMADSVLRARPEAQP